MPNAFRGRARSSAGGAGATPEGANQPHGTHRGGPRAPRIRVQGPPLDRRSASDHGRPGDTQDVSGFRSRRAERKTSDVDFTVEEEREILRKTVRSFLDREVPRELARQLDEDRDLPLDLFQKIGALGWMGLTIDEAYGGAGGDYVDLAIVIEELSRRMAALAFIVAAPVFMCGASIGRYGTEEQKHQYLPRIADGSDRWCIALTEPGGGTDVLAMKTRATEYEPGRWRIN